MYAKLAKVVEPGGFRRDMRFIDCGFHSAHHSWCRLRCGMESVCQPLRTLSGLSALIVRSVGEHHLKTPATKRDVALAMANFLFRAKL
jgi:hypothetical protein